MKSFLRIALAAIVLCAAGAGVYVWFYGVPDNMPLLSDGQEKKEERPPTPVGLAKSQEADVTLTVEAVGNVVAVNSVTLSTRVTGRVEEVAFTDGQTVEEGQLLVRLDPAEQGAVVAAAEARRDELQQALSRADQLASTGAGPQATADDRGRQLEAAESQVRSAREQLDDYNIRAPFTGRLGLRDISVGALAQPGTQIVTIDSIDPIEVRFALPERYLNQVRPETRIRATTPAFPDDEFAGSVAVVANRVDPALRTVQIEARLPNKDGRLRPGMLMEMTVDLGRREKSVVVPPLAVKLQGATHFVYTVADGKAKRVDVEIGQRDPDKVEILKGLEKDVEVIVQGPQSLTAGQAVEPKKEGEGQAPPQQAAANPEQAG